MQDRIPPVYRLVLSTLEKIGLMGIAIATVIAATHDVALMFEHGRVTLADLLLMFIYLEVLAMVNHYFQSGQLPVRFPLYIGMVALARHLILDMKELDVGHILAISGAIVFLAVAVLILRFGHVKFPYGDVPSLHEKRTPPKKTDDSPT